MQNVWKVVADISLVATVITALNSQTANKNLSYFVARCSVLLHPLLGMECRVMFLPISVSFLTGDVQVLHKQFFQIVCFKPFCVNKKTNMCNDSVLV